MARRMVLTLAVVLVVIGSLGLVKYKQIEAAPGRYVKAKA